MSWLRAWGGALLFGFTAAAAALSLSAYTARTRAVAMRHVYFDAWHVLPGFTLFTALLSTTIVANALPTIIGDLQASQTAYAWVITAALLTNARPMVDGLESMLDDTDDVIFEASFGKDPWGSRVVVRQPAGL